MQGSTFISEICLLKFQQIVLDDDDHVNVNVNVNDDVDYDNNDMTIININDGYFGLYNEY
mgnify:CR=1 FL=1|tara:strand:+ start:141 stop:320 length:180 start_codon:yes stop_codon:yes gene_type:complete